METGKCVVVCDRKFQGLDIPKCASFTVKRKRKEKETAITRWSTEDAWHTWTCGSSPFSYGSGRRMRNDGIEYERFDSELQYECCKAHFVDDRHNRMLRCSVVSRHGNTKILVKCPELDLLAEGVQRRRNREVAPNIFARNFMHGVGHV